MRFWTWFLVACLVVSPSSMLAVAAAEEDSPTVKSAIPNWPTPNWPSHSLRLDSLTSRQSPPVVTSVSLQPGGPLLASAGDDHLVRLWNTETGQLTHRLEGHTDWVRSVAFSPDGQTLFTAGNDRLIIVWDPSSGEQLSVLAQQPQVVSKILPSHDGRLLATIGFEDKLRIYDAIRGSLLHELTCPCGDMRALAFSSDDSTLAGGGRDGKIRLWNVANGAQIQERQLHRRRIRSLDFSADGLQIITAGEDRSIRIWNYTDDSADDESVAQLSTGPAKVLCMVSLGAARVATGGSDNLIRLWDLKQRKQIGELVGHTGSVATLAYANGLLVSGSYDTTIRVWKVDDQFADDRQENNRVGAAQPQQIE